MIIKTPQIGVNKASAGMLSAREVYGNKAVHRLGVWPRAPLAFHRYVRENTRKEQYDRASAEWKRSLPSAFLPFELDASRGGLLEVDRGDLLEHSGEALEQIGRNNPEKALGKTGKAVGKGLGFIEKFEAIYDTLVLMTEVPRKIVDDKRIAKKTDETHMLNANVWIELQALDVEYKTRLRDFEARECYRYVSGS